MDELALTLNAPGKKMFLLGNEAVARGAVEAGVGVVASYPGTPSSEITEVLADIASNTGMYVEWSVNEKVAFEVAFAASMCGIRALTAMKHVGLNVAHESLMSASYIGAIGGFVVLSADDPSCWSSQNEQDNRYIARQAYVPVLEPSSVQEAKDMAAAAFRLSEQFGQIFMVRTVTNVSHGRSDVSLGEITTEKPKGKFNRDPQRFSSGPVPARINRRLVIERIVKIREANETLPYNRLEGPETADLGIAACGLSYAYVKEAVRWLGLDGKVRLMKIGTPYPLPPQLTLNLLRSVKKLLVVEELEPFIEDEIRVIANENNICLEIRGKDLVPLVGELSTDKITEAVAAFAGIKTPVDFADLRRQEKEIKAATALRPAALCAGCPHRASHYAIKIASQKFARETGKDVPIYSGDIGCYGNGGSQAPLFTRDVSLCMGSGFGIATGFSHVVDTPVIGYCGDSTFFHSGMAPMVNAVFNKSRMVMIVMDNAATAMTGFEANPGTGHTAMGEATAALKAEDFARAADIKFIEVVDPCESKKAIDAVGRALRFDGPSFIVFRRLCTTLEAREKRLRGEKTIPYRINREKCNNCKLCINSLGCSALIIENSDVTIDNTQCTGCGLCAQVCNRDAIIQDGGN